MTSIRTDNATLSTAAWTVYTATIIAASLETTAYRRTVTVVRSTTKPDTDVAKCLLFGPVLVLRAASR